MLLSQTIRMDAAGSGKYGAPRGKRKHNGIDLLVSEGQAVFAPFDGTLVRAAFPYVGDSKWTGFVLRSKANPKEEMKVFYAKAHANLIGKEVTKGQEIATGQAISKRYPKLPMKDHIHIEVKIDGKAVDPTPLFF
jgi:murein DD-endopeptidase MepM/ murein hydrolase activator NlpD